MPTRVEYGVMLGLISVIGGAGVVTTVENFDGSLEGVHPLVAEADENKDGRISVQEALKLLSKFDKEGRSYLSDEELAEANKLFEDVPSSRASNVAESKANFLRAQEIMLQARLTATILKNQQGKK